jgi:hypothetical protein
MGGQSENYSSIAPPGFRRRDTRTHLYEGYKQLLRKVRKADRRIIVRASQVFLPPGALDIGGFANGEGVAPPFLMFFSAFGFFFSLLLRI